MNKKAIIMLLFFCVIISVAFLEYNRGHQYSVGMTASEVAVLTGGLYKMQTYGLEADARLNQKDEDLVYYIYDEKDGMLLSFNHRKILINKKRIKVFGLNYFQAIDTVRLYMNKLGVNQN